MRLVATLLIAASLSATSRVRADEKAVCSKAYVDGQTFRQDGKLRAARVELLACARPGCPASLTGDCAKWLGEVDESLPTVVIAARDGGSDVSDVRVFFDGELVADHLGGAAIPLDPGEHVLRFERGDVHKEQRVSIREAEKNRRIDITLTPAPAPAPTPVPTAIRPLERARPVPLATLIAGGAGIVSLGGFAGFAAVSLAKRNDLDASHCKPNCGQDDVRTIQNGFLVADVLAGAGVVSIAIATALYFTRPTVLRPVPAVTIGVVPGGAFGSIGASF